MRRSRELITLLLAVVFITYIPYGKAVPVRTYAADTATGTESASSGDVISDDDSDAVMGIDSIMREIEPTLPVNDVDVLICGPELTEDEIDAILEEQRQQSNMRSLKAPVYNSDPGTMTLNSGSGSYGYGKMNEFQKAAYDALEASYAAFVTTDKFGTATYNSDSSVNTTFEYDVASVGTSHVLAYL